MVDEPSEPTESAVDPLLEQYHQTLKRIVALPELPMRRAAVGEALERLDDDQTVWWIDQLIRGALWGRSPEIDAMLACADWLVRLRLEDDYARLQALYEAATHAERDGVLMLLRDPPPHRALRKGASLPEVRLPVEREITLGERRSMARGRDRRYLERLLLDPSPLVIRNLLKNPHLRVQDVLVVATRRPTKPELTMEVALNTRWFKSHRIREALVQNPYSATGLSLRLLPTLRIHTLRRIRNAGDLHPWVHDTAEMLVELREQRTAPWRV
jgi:hypothetical protein